jgi:hypothetical protein
LPSYATIQQENKTQMEKKKGGWGELWSRFHLTFSFGLSCLLTQKIGGGGKPKQD